MDLPWGATRPAPTEESVLLRSSQVHFRFDIHPRPKLVVLIFARLQNNLYRYPLNDFHVVTGCIFGRQQAEEGARCSRNAIDMTAVRAAVRVEVNLCFLAHAHVFELGLFEIRGDPHLIEGNHSEHLLPRLDVQSDNNLFRDLPGYRREYFGVSEIQLRLFDSGSFLVCIRHGGERFGARGGDALRPGLGIFVVSLSFPLQPADGDGDA